MSVRTFCAVILGSIILCGVAVLLFGAWQSPERILMRIKSGPQKEVAQIWKELGIDSDLELTNSDITVRAEMIPTWRIPGRQCMAVLCLSDSHLWNWQYLLFTRRWGHWRFVGNIDLAYQKYELPSARFATISPTEICMVIRELSCSGTGCLLYEDVWYGWADGCVKELLRYPVEGYVVGWGLPFERKFTTTLNYEGFDSDGLFTVAITVREEFYPKGHFEEGPCAFSDHRRVVYDWQAVQHRFCLNERESEMTAVQLQGIWDDGAKELLTRYARKKQELHQ
jgi:hypothetical protein